VTGEQIVNPVASHEQIVNPQRFDRALAERAD
jgi:hypothetical protein